MDQVSAGLQRQVAADSAGLGFSGIGGPYRPADDLHGVAAFQDGGDNRAGGNVGDEPLVERLALVLPVVAAGHRFLHLEQAQGGDTKAATLQPRQDLAGEAALHRVRLYEDQSAFHVAPYCSIGAATG